MFSELMPSAHCQRIALCRQTPPPQTHPLCQRAPKGHPGPGEDRAATAASAGTERSQPQAAGKRGRGVSPGGVYGQGAALGQPGRSGGRRSTASPLLRGRRARLSPPACDSCPGPSACTGYGNAGEGTPTASWAGSGRARGGSKLRVCDTGGRRALPAPSPCRMSLHCRAGREQRPGEPSAPAWGRLEPNHVQVLREIPRRTDLTFTAGQRLAWLLSSLEASASLVRAAEGCGQPLEQPSINLLPLHHTQESHGRGRDALAALVRGRDTAPPCPPPLPRGARTAALWMLPEGVDAV